MKFKQNSILFCITAILILGCKNAIKKNPDQESNNSDTYALVNDWPRLPANFTLGSPTGLGLDSKGNIIAFHRSGREWKTMPISHKSAIKENTISKIDSNTGEIIKSWDELERDISDSSIKSAIETITKEIQTDANKLMNEGAPFSHIVYFNTKIPIGKNDIEDISKNIHKSFKNQNNSELKIWYAQGGIENRFKNKTYTYCYPD